MIQMKKIVIIGGGISGLSTGCYAKMNGYDAHIYEMHTFPGGLCTSWKRGGYTFDGSIHWLEGTSSDHPFNKIWQELGALKDKKIYYKDMSYKIFVNNHSITLFNDPEKLKKYLYEIAPEDGEMIDELADALKLFYRFQNMPLPKPKELFSVFDKLQAVKNNLPAIRLFQKYGQMTVEEFAQKFRNPVLREAIRTTIETAPTGSDSTNGIVGVLFVMATKGSGFPEGGSLALARNIEKRCIDLGGKIHYGARVNQILVENHAAVGIQLEDGSLEAADIVISASDGYTTIYQLLGGRYTNHKINHCYEKEAVTPSTVQVSIGVNMDVSSIIDPHAVFNMYPLERPITVAGRANHMIRIKNYAFDPSFAPKGKSTLVVIFGSDSADWENIYTDQDKYREEKGRIKEEVIAFLENIAPGIEEKIETVDVATPMTYIRYTNTWKGSSMGFAKNFLLNLPRTLPKLRNFYMVGQWVGDMGVSGAAKSGRDIIQLICRQDNKGFATSQT
jgi:phytoene dehydrogenase-like protein